jgi:xanthine dehydrogenase YagS FAD-binding subunit
MELFQLSRASNVEDAVRVGATSHTAQQGAEVRFLAGGTTLLDLMKLNVEKPGRVVDISRLPLGAVEATAAGAQPCAMPISRIIR